METTELRKLFYSRLSELYRLNCISALLGWDQQVYMPPKAAQGRAEQLESISIITHQKIVDPDFAKVVDELYEKRDSLSIEDQVNARETKRVLDKQRKLPDDFVSEMAQACALGYSEWVKARPANDFAAIKPSLERIVALVKRKADLLGYDENPYDALIDDFEPGAKASTVKPLLMNLAEKLAEIIPPITKRFKDLPRLQGHYDQKSQYELARRVVKDLGFDFETGRIDTTAHPFMTTLGRADIRITTRYDESDFLMSLYSTIHETGHALYEMGLDREWAGTPMGEPVSLGIHESQSRMWENLVGRSREYAKYLSGIIKEYIPQDSNLHDPDKLWQYVNRVEPSLVRTEADEVTYSQHIVIRMLLELAVVNNELSVTDLPDAWNELYEKYLGIKPTDYKNGVMQDVHWYSGSIGYFPTYALGNLYNAMMMEVAKRDIPDLSQQIERGEFSKLLAWLRENVHKHGMRYHGPELIRNITGKDLSAEPFVNYLKNKFLD